MRYSYYFCEFNYEGEAIRRNLKVSQNHLFTEKLNGKTPKQVIEETWGLPVTTIKKTTKFNYVNGQF